MKYAQRAINHHETLNHIAMVAVNAMNVWREARELTEKAFIFAEGGSWAYNTDLRDSLHQAGFPTLNINLIFPRLLRISGNEREVRSRMTAIPTQDAGIVDADVATRLLDWVTQISRGDVEFSRAFLHSLIGRMGGWIEYLWSNKRIPLGAPYYRHVNPYFILPDPAFGLYEIDKHRFIIKTYWATSEDMIANFPDKEDEIRQVMGDFGTQRSLMQGLQGWWQRVMGGGEERKNEFVNEKENTLRIFEMQERRPEREFLVVNVTDGRKKVVDSLQIAEAIVERFSGLEAVERAVDKIWTMTSLADYVLLQEELNEVQNGYFSILPVGGYDFSGRNFSMVDQLTGVQEEYERARSSMLHILHTTAASGWQYADGALDPDMESRLESDGAAPGLILKHKQGFGKPEKIQPNQLPPGEADRAALASNDADIISSIGPGELGQPEGGAESGILHSQRVKEAITTLRPMMDNVNLTKEILAQCLLDLMRVKLTPGRTVKIVGAENKVERITVGNELQIGEFEIKIIPGNNSDTQRLQRLIEADTMIARMPPDLVPWHLYIGMLDWPDKDKWVEYISQRLGISQANQNQLMQAVAQLQSGLQMDNAPMEGMDMNAGGGMAVPQQDMETPQYEMVQ